MRTWTPAQADIGRAFPPIQLGLPVLAVAELCSQADNRLPIFQSCKHEGSRVLMVGAQWADRPSVSLAAIAIYKGHLGVGGQRSESAADHFGFSILPVVSESSMPSLFARFRFLAVPLALAVGHLSLAQTTGTVTQTVSQRHTMGGLTVSPTSSLVTGSTATFSFTLQTGGAPAPISETVQFLDGGTAFGTPQAITSIAGSNLLPYSQVDTAHGWTTTGTAPTITVGAANGPDGSTATATQVVFPSTVSTPSGVTLAVPGTAYANLPMTLSIWAQSASPTTITLTVADSPAVAATNSTTCAVTSTWRRCMLTYTFPANAGTGVSVAVSSTGQPTQTVNLWGAQVEQATTASPFVSTIGTARPTGGAGGAVTFPYSIFHAGTHTVTVQYTGNSNLTSSISNAVTVVVGKDPPAVTLSSSPASTSVYGVSITFTAVVAAASGDPTNIPTGTVQFFDGATSLGTISVDGSGNAALTLSGATSLAAGSHSITAVYSGDSDYSTVTSAAESYTVTKAHSTLTTTVASSLNPSTYGDQVVLSVHVVSSAGVTPTGTVAIVDGSTNIGTITLDGSGSGTLTVPLFTAGTHSITVTYSGDGNYN